MRQVFITDCGCFMAVPYGENVADYDVIETQTGKVWLVPRYKPSGFNDTDRRYTHAEFPHMSTGWSNRGRRRGGRWIPAFELTFADTDTTVPIKAFSGNVVIRHYEACFRRTIPRGHTRRIRAAEAAIAAAVERLTTR